MDQLQIFLTVSSLSQFSANGESKTITIRSNVRWDVTENTSWISINRTRGSNNGSVTVTSSENKSSNNRSATITISGAGITRSVSVSQDGANNDPTTYTPIPELIQAENFVTQSGIRTENTSDNGGGENVGFIDTGNFLTYNINVPVSGDYTIDFRVVSRSNGTSFDIYSGNSIVGNISSGANGGWQVWETVSETVNLNRGDQTIRLLATGNGWNINWLDFDNDGGTNNSINLALNGSASQSTTAFNGSASRAIDGNTNGSYNDGSVTHTAANTGSWWQVRLSEQTTIGDIIIYNRTNSCCINRLSNFTVSILNNIGNEVYNQTITNTPNSSLTINAGSVLGRTVRITTNLQNTPLSLAEVEVYEEETSIPSCSAETNLVLNGRIVDFSTQQNSTNAVNTIIDGNSNNRWSALGFSQFALVDLGETYSVNQINLLTYRNRDYQFRVEGSINSPTSGFRTLVNASNNSDSGPINKSFNAQNVHYVKLTVTGLIVMQGIGYRLVILKLYAQDYQLQN